MFKVTKLKNCAYFAKKLFKPISVFESKKGRQNQIRYFYVSVTVHFVIMTSLVFLA